MLGQTKILEKITSLNIDNFPHSLLLSGPEGCGKHLLCEEISNHLNIPVIDITENINKEYLDEISLKVEPYLYIINLSNLQEREQNIILKTLEEPLKNTFLILLDSQTNKIIETIKNRCQTWEFEKYSEEDLRKFTPEDIAKDYLRVFDTPGKRLMLEGENLSLYIDLADKIINKINIASLPNTLSIPNKIGFKEEKDKLNLKIFKYILLERASFFLKEINNNAILNEFLVINNYVKNSFLPKVDQKILLDNFLINLWEVSRNGSKIS